MNNIKKISTTYNEVAKVYILSKAQQWEPIWNSEPSIEIIYDFNNTGEVCWLRTSPNDFIDIKIQVENIEENSLEFEFSSNQISIKKLESDNLYRLSTSINSDSNSCEGKETLTVLGEDEYGNAISQNLDIYLLGQKYTGPKMLVTYNVATSITTNSIEYYGVSAIFSTKSLQAKYGDNENIVQNLISFTIDPKYKFPDVSIDNYGTGEYQYINAYANLNNNKIEIVYSIPTYSGITTINSNFNASGAGVVKYWINDLEGQNTEYEQYIEINLTGGKIND